MPWFSREKCGSLWESGQVSNVLAQRCGWEKSTSDGGGGGGSPHAAPGTGQGGLCLTARVTPGFPTHPLPPPIGELQSAQYPCGHTAHSVASGLSWPAEGRTGGKPEAAKPGWSQVLRKEAWPQKTPPRHGALASSREPAVSPDPRMLPPAESSPKSTPGLKNTCGGWVLPGETASDCRGAL